MDARPLPDMFVVGCDIESHLFTQGCMTPRVVCATFYFPQGWSPLPAIPLPHIVGAAGAGEVLITGIVNIVAAVTWVLQQPNMILTFHNTCFDMGCLVAAGVDIGLVDAAIKAGRLVDTQLREQLIALAQGNFRFDNRSKKTVKGIFSLDYCMQVRFGREPPKNKMKAKGWADVVRRLRCSFGCPVVCGHLPSATAARCSECAGWGLKGPWRLRFVQLDGVPATLWPTDAIDYAILDARDAHDLYEDQSAPTEVCGCLLVDEAGVVTGEREHMWWSWGLVSVAIYGIRTSRQATDELEASIQDVVLAGQQAALQAGFLRGPDGMCAGAPGAKRGKPGSKNVKVLRALVEAGAPGEVRLTDGGAVSTERDILLESNNPHLVIYGKGGKFEKLRTTYIPILRRGHQYAIVAYYHFLATGRAGQSKPTLQTAPRDGDYRTCFEPRPGFFYLSADYGQAELVALAHLHRLMGFSDELGEMINNKDDLHIRLVSNIPGFDSYEVLMEKKAAKDPFTLKWRQAAKAANYGFGGMMGAEAFQAAKKKEGLILSLTDCYTLREAWFSMIPAMRRYFDSVKREIAGFEGGLLEHASGLLRWTSKPAAGANSLFQNEVACITKEANCRVVVACRDPKNPLYGSHPVLFLHDELFLETPADTTKTLAAAQELRRIMLGVARERIPDLHWEADFAIMKQWYKGAEAVYNKKRELIPWTPKN